MGSLEDFRCNDVPVFLAESNGGPNCRAVVCFRAGINDESLAFAGITRLAAETIHATLPLEIRSFVTTQVGNVITAFFIDAPSDRFSECFEKLSIAINNPDPHQMEQQRSLLEVDPDFWETAPYEADLLRLRFGLVGPGLRLCNAFALKYASEDHVKKWIHTNLCRQNSAIMASETWLDSDRFLLPEGQRHETKPHTPLDVAFPAIAAGFEQSVSFQTLFRKDVGSTITSKLFLDVLTKRVTELHPLTPRVTSSLITVDAKTRALSCFMPTANENAQEVVNAIMQSLTDIAEGWTSEDVIREQSEDYGRTIAAITEVERAYGRALNYLAPGTATLAELTGQTTQATVSEVTEAAKFALKHMLICIPEECTVEDVPDYEFAPREKVEGTHYKKLGITRFLPNVTQIIANDQGLSYVHKKQSITIRFSECCFLIDGDIRLELADTRGNSLRFFPGLYANGAELARTIRGNVPADVQIKEEPSNSEKLSYKRQFKAVKDFTGWRKFLAFPLALYFPALIIYNAVHFAQGNSDNFQNLLLVAGVIGVVFVVRRTRNRTPRQ